MNFTFVLAMLVVAFMMIVVDETVAEALAARTIELTTVFVSYY